MFNWDVQGKAIIPTRLNGCSRAGLAKFSKKLNILATQTRQPPIRDSYCPLHSRANYFQNQNQLDTKINPKIDPKLTLLYIHYGLRRQRSKVTDPLWSWWHALAVGGLMWRILGYFRFSRVLARTAGFPQLSPQYHTPEASKIHQIYIISYCLLYVFYSILLLRLRSSI